MPQSSWIAAGGLASLFMAPPVVEANFNNFPRHENNAGTFHAGGQVEVQEKSRRLRGESVSTPAPSSVGREEEGAVYLGCFHDSKGDRVLGDKITSSDMTTEVCLEHCTSLGAAFMATQYGFECWCSADGGLDYERHYEIVGEDAVCDFLCHGDNTEMCGGFDSFDLYKLPMCSGSLVEAYEQCGGSDWKGSRCCSDGLECVEMGSGGCYSQCRPSGTDAATPSPSSVEEATPSPTTTTKVTPTPDPVAPTAEPTPAPVTAPSPGPVTPYTKPTPAPVIAPTPEPVTPYIESTPAPVTASTPGPAAPYIESTPAPVTAPTPEPVTPYTKPTPAPVLAPTPGPVTPYIESTPAPVTAPTPEPVTPYIESTPAPVAAPTPGPVEPMPERTPAPVTAPTPVPVTPATSGSPTPADMAVLLDLHNEARCMHGADPLTWSTDVTDSAMVHANTLTSACVEDLFHSTREDRNGYGENLFACYGGDSCYSPENAMRALYTNEVAPDGVPYDSVTKYGGHATQILWKSSEELGCVTAQCDTGVPRTFLVCQYSPAGNVHGFFEDEVALPANEGSCV